MNGIHGTIYNIEHKTKKLYLQNRKSKSVLKDIEKLAQEERERTETMNDLLAGALGVVTIALVPLLGISLYRVLKNKHSAYVL